MNSGAYEHSISELVESVDIIDCDTLKFWTLRSTELGFSYRHSVFMDKKYLIVGAKLKLYERPEKEIIAEMDGIIAKRKASQPLNYPSAGSFFKRCAGHYTSKMIDECGLKGCRVGEAEVSTKHAGFIVNCGNATAEDVLKLADIVREKVKAKFGVEIENEVIKVCKK